MNEIIEKIEQKSDRTLNFPFCLSREKTLAVFPQSIASFYLGEVLSMVYLFSHKTQIKHLLDGLLFLKKCRLCPTIFCTNAG